MDGKRANEEATDTKDIVVKRAKKDFPLDISLDGVEYLNLSCLVKTPPYAAYYSRHFKKSETQLIQAFKVDTFHVTMDNVARGVFEHKSLYRPASDLRLVRKDGKIMAFIELAQGTAHPLAPPLIDDVGFFEDALGEHHAVEMRGVRTTQGIYFKVKDVGCVLGTATLADDVQLKHTKAREGDDYVRFTEGIFFTFVGLLRAITRSRMPNAERLCVWVCDTVFCVGFGTEEQKTQLAKSLLNKKAIDELTKRCVNDIGGLYLLETMNQPPVDDSDIKKKVYKYGYTKNVHDRMGKHVSTYGRESVVHAFVLLPIPFVSTAETKLKRILQNHYIHKEGKNTELLLLSEQDLTTVLELMRVIGETFYGETYVHTHQLEVLAKDAEIVKRDHALELAKKNLALIVAEKDAEMAKKDNTILEMKIEAHARRIKELEDQLPQCCKCHAP